MRVHTSLVIKHISQQPSSTSYQWYMVI